MTRDSAWMLYNRPTDTTFSEKSSAFSCLSFLCAVPPAGIFPPVSPGMVRLQGASQFSFPISPLIPSSDPWSSPSLLTKPLLSSTYHRSNATATRSKGVPRWGTWALSSAPLVCGWNVSTHTRSRIEPEEPAYWFPVLHPRRMSWVWIPGPAE